MKRSGLERIIKIREYDFLWIRMGHSEPERVSKTRECDLFRIRVGQKESTRSEDTIYYE